jgi:hypothetical protein
MPTISLSKDLPYYKGQSLFDESVERGLFHDSVDHSPGRVETEGRCRRSSMKLFALYSLLNHSLSG